jgi:hypothetical protein
VIPGPARGSNQPAAAAGEQSVSVSPIVPLGSSVPNFSGYATLPLHGAAPAVAAPAVAPPAFVAPAVAAPAVAAPAVAPPAFVVPAVAAPAVAAPVANTPSVGAGSPVNGSGSNGNGAATAESTGNFQRLARAFHDGAEVQPAPAAIPTLPVAVYEPVPAQPAFSDDPPLAADSAAPAPLDLLLRDAARIAARASIEASQEEGVYIVRLLKSEEGAPEGAHEALVVLVDPNSDLFDSN